MTSDYVFKTKPFQHQLDTFLETRDKEYYGLFLEQGCVDCETEYLSPEGWVKISEYQGGKVAQWNNETGEAEFVHPLEYIVGDCEDMLHFTGRGLDQMLTTGHRMPLLASHREGNLRVESALDVAKHVWSTPTKMRRLPARFTMTLNGTGIPLTDNQLRLMVAVFADGHFPKQCKTARCTIRIKKQRKIDRLRKLLDGIPVYERMSGDFTVFTFPAPFRGKQFPSEWWELINDHQKDIIVDEVFHWDGSVPKNKNKGAAYFSRHESDADFIQFLLSSSGFISSKRFGNGVWDVRVRGSRTNGYWVRGQNVKKVKSPDGKKYCFSVPSTFLILRRNGYIFPTGNTGKSKITLDTASWLYGRGKIDCLLIVAPNGVNRNWVLNEIPAHVPDYINYEAAWYASQPTKKEKQNIENVIESKNCLRFLSMNIEAFATQKGVAFAKNVLNTFETMLVIDESSVIKNPKAIRTKNLLKLGKLAKYRRILTGTPVTQGPLDLFTQFSFLDDHILPTTSYYAFRARFAILKEMQTAGRSFMNVVGYRDIDKLVEYIKPHSTRLTKDDCLDLPDKIFQKRFVYLSKEQKKLYNDIKNNIITEFAGEVVTTQMALTKLLRLQQVLGGFVKVDETEEVIPIDKINARVSVLLDTLQETAGKAIIFARFRAEIEEIVKSLEKEFGKGCCVQYHGGVDNAQRSANIKAFQNDPTVRFFVGNVQSAGKGLTLTAATTVIYFSNTFSLEDRLQSEDRAHRIGQKHSVTYIDLIAVGTIDEHIVKALRSKKNLADMITGDDISKWL